MSFVVEIAKSATIRLGLPVTKNLDSFEIILKVGITFTDKQLTKDGRFSGSDALDKIIAKQIEYLTSDTWAKLFDFQPTFELVSKWLCEQLRPQVKQLEYVELDNKTLGVVTQYIP